MSLWRMHTPTLLIPLSWQAEVASLYFQSEKVIMKAWLSLPHIRYSRSIIGLLERQKLQEASTILEDMRSHLHFQSAVQLRLLQMSPATRDQQSFSRPPKSFESTPHTANFRHACAPSYRACHPYNFRLTLERPLRVQMRLIVQLRAAVQSDMRTSVGE
jgi:hypothetical protein